MTTVNDSPVPFRDLGLVAPVLDALERVGYEYPTPIQLQTIPLLIEGRDVLGQAQTGTGKTAAFALPLLSMIDLDDASPQVLVLTPTRELAIQVAEAFQKYAAFIDDFHVLPIYGGQDYSGQLKRLKRGVHIVVGTPGRVIDHIKRSSLKLDHLKTLVLDEADEMLRMGFIDDVEWIMEQTPSERQVALFSATMPQAILRIARKYLDAPAEITIAAKSSTVDAISQRFLTVSGHHKLEALTRILEAEPFDGVIIFVRTRVATQDLAEKLRARGYAAAALSGEMAQVQREKTVGQLKSGKLNIIVATDVAARGLDVERITHVINYDIPTDTEAYVHRIGRTGRAGRTGDAILFVTPREKSMLRTIERVTGSRIDRMELPSAEVINDRRIANFKQQITEVLSTEDLGRYEELVSEYCSDYDASPVLVAAALVQMAQGEQPLLVTEELPVRENFRKEKERRGKEKKSSRRQSGLPGQEGYETFRLEVGASHGVKPGNIAGALINETGIPPEAVGRIEIFDDHSMVNLPEGMPKDLFRELKRVWVCGQQLNISRTGEGSASRSSSARIRKARHSIKRTSRSKRKGR
ncbi:DEAD/DEAH box helicase [Prosthecochloris sp. N3]|uniref:ATP-dependent RNA helicase DeaD n=1 Tax=Prosthecochloris ethylica TaxID=2743976 RepID=A0ABR9XRQ2_9CHLB|nr:DEAD/DEAH box helicase [Prosthecochloris ethylica]MBF0586748.1 DEAD/DEAH box helicase [Prosthecochloris ethylica]MBF0636654.1 DEAD/DEAH box helicase [Prosthecochloris ethylica]NUK47947.1 DEAD/DEAH box helicase [Prosthecochloris ethylica]